MRCSAEELQTICCLDGSEEADDADDQGQEVQVFVLLHELVLHDLHEKEEESASKRNRSVDPPTLFHDDTSFTVGVRSRIF